VAATHLRFQKGPGAPASCSPLAPGVVPTCALTAAWLYCVPPCGTDPQTVKRLASLIDPVKVVAGGRFDEETRYLDPTLLYPVSWSDTVMQDEIFGPILPILPILLSEFRPPRSQCLRQAQHVALHPRGETLGRTAIDAMRSGWTRTVTRSDLPAVSCSRTRPDSSGSCDPVAPACARRERACSKIVALWNSVPMGGHRTSVGSLAEARAPPFLACRAASRTP
jgi:hypothetical protein